MKGMYQVTVQGIREKFPLKSSMVLGKIIYERTSKECGKEYPRKEQLRKSARTYATKYAKKNRKELCQKGRTELCNNCTRKKGRKLR